MEQDEKTESVHTHAHAHMPVMDGMQNAKYSRINVYDDPMMNIYDGDLRLQGVPNTDVLCVCSLGAVGQPDYQMDGKWGILSHTVLCAVSGFTGTYNHGNYLLFIPNTGPEVVHRKKPWRTKPIAESFSTML
ncbi:uncharacterized protein BDCG_08599 [Blastomyces dermatitidis ER-3]|uniref:Uncharacterized protein n=1 Tax=Ajellomyces dermatitidis (strain ER-3 / ATCC MYA-2586) TaxID=559297 RepID=A0ABP2ES27_AJEDR|nr:uncharacterized protein BDCG_08599 [Blastomyces dermatitidis ER-3]EEQ85330.1 hypothetical protein BDCG_08599 [Blastomyces dermatitidis ER-3]